MRKFEVKQKKRRKLFDLLGINVVLPVEFNKDSSSLDDNFNGRVSESEASSLCRLSAVMAEAERSPYFCSNSRRRSRR